MNSTGMSCEIHTSKIELMPIPQLDRYLGLEKEEDLGHCQMLICIYVQNSMIVLNFKLLREDFKSRRVSLPYERCSSST